VRKPHQRAAPLVLHPRGGQLQRRATRRIDLKLHLAKPVAQRRHLFAEQQAALLQIAHVAGEALDLRQVVRREKECRLADAVEQALDQLVAHQRIEPRKRLVEHQQRGAEAKRSRESRLHPHAT
jgi:hypothetical protein